MIKKDNKESKTEEIIIENNDSAPKPQQDERVKDDSRLDTSKQIEEKILQMAEEVKRSRQNRRDRSGSS